MNTWFTIRTFLAFYFVLFGFAYMHGAPDERAPFGAFLAAVGAIFFGAFGWQYEQADGLYGARFWNPMKKCAGPWLWCFVYFATLVVDSRSCNGLRSADYALPREL